MTIFVLISKFRKPTDIYIISICVEDRTTTSINLNTAMLYGFNIINTGKCRNKYRKHYHPIYI